MLLNSTPSLLLYYCASDKPSLYVTTSLFAFKVIFILPLSTFILYLGHQRWRQQHSSKTATHSDIFTYHVAALQQLWVFGTLCFFGGSYAEYPAMVAVGISISVIVSNGEVFFQVLTCVEHYLAVVHPITYIGLRNARVVRIRNIFIRCVWLLCFGMMSVAVVTLPQSTPIPMLCVLGSSIIIISFCSLSVLCVLIRPGPGEAGGEKQRVDQSKQRAFYTITAISVTVWLWFAGFLVALAVNTSSLLRDGVGCLMMSCIDLLNMPCSLVSPLLYLHRAGKLSWCC